MEFLEAAGLVAATSGGKALRRALLQANDIPLIDQSAR
jgi:hypothetical protein